MLSALKAARRPAELVTVPGGDYAWSRGAARLQMLQSTVAFLEKHNLPR
jgi:dipeptidyl aminopeptidase/acylaminoacyl peptidase